MNDALTLSPLALGAPVYSRNRRGFVAAIAEEAGRAFVLGSGAMRQVRANLVIVWADGSISPDIPDTMAADWMAEARRIGLDTVPDHAERYRAALAARDDRRRAEADAAAKLNAQIAEFHAMAAEHVPAGAKAVIIAELRRDASDSMSDYYGSSTARTVILAFSSHNRDLFPELRKAALNHPETAFLADAPESAEHREKYSMGGGYYLATGGRHSGWQVRKRSLSPADVVRSIPFGEWSVPNRETPASVAAVSVSHGLSFTVEKHRHTKRGFDMWIAVPSARVERDEFERLRDAAEALGGWYSKPWGRTPGGFAFTDEATAQAFANATPAPTPEGDGPAPAPTRPGMGDKLRTIAEGMQKEIDNGYRDRLSNTPKRQREAASARLEGARWERAQAGLRALAALHDAGNVPPELAQVTTKAKAYELAGSIIDHSRGGYYDAGIDTGKPRHDTPEGLAFWALIGGPSAERAAAEELRRKIDALQFANIAGYFPTPAAIVARMIEAAEIPAGATVLEPSAGSGAILDGVRAAHPDALLYPVERHATLRQILKAKGYQLHGDDFTTCEVGRDFDRVLMNPPFEGGQDMAHVRLAFDHLKPGGRLVAIMSPGPFFRQDRKAAEFRDWLYSFDGTREDIPAGAFRESGTGVATVLVVIDKPGAEAEADAPSAAVRGLTWGTSHFHSIASARDYYARQGLSSADVLDKLEAGEIHIGAPTPEDGQTVELDQAEGRYRIRSGA